VLELVGLSEYADGRSGVVGVRCSAVALARSIVYRPQFCCWTNPCPISMPNCGVRADDRRASSSRPGMTARYVTHDQPRRSVAWRSHRRNARWQLLQMGSPDEIYNGPDLFVANFNRAHMRSPHV